MMFEKLIAIGLAPNQDKDDLIQTLKIILKPWFWIKGDSVKKIEDWFKRYFKVNTAISFNSGRSALYAILKSLSIGKGDEVIVQAFSCVAVANCVIWTGAKPIYVDIDQNLNISIESLERNITPYTKAIIVQHTFGVPADIISIKKIAQKHNLIVIEDCAHSLGATYQGKKIGNYGDFSIFSFGRDKVISSVFGGLAIVNNNNKSFGQKLEEFSQGLSFPSHSFVLQQLMHPLAFSIILPLYNLGIGKLILIILQKIHLLSFPVLNIEKKALRPKFIPQKYPNALAGILLGQLNKLEKYNEHRKEIANYYRTNLFSMKNINLPYDVKGAIYLRYNILTPKANKILSAAKKQRIILGNWYRNIIDPAGVDFPSIHFQPKLYPVAQKFAQQSLNLPTYPRITYQDADKIINLINKYAS